MIVEPNWARKRRGQVLSHSSHPIWWPLSRRVLEWDPAGWPASVNGVIGWAVGFLKAVWRVRFFVSRETSLNPSDFLFLRARRRAEKLKACPW